MGNVKQLEFTENKKIELCYDIFVGILAVVATLVVILQFNNTINEVEMRYLRIADKIIYGIFVLEFIIRVYFSKNRYNYIKKNFIDGIAIIPFWIFTASPYGSVFKLLRVFIYVLRLIDNMKELLYVNGFIYSLGWTVIITIIGSFGIYIFEKESSATIKSYWDALWWSFVTVTTVGYGDISPSTPIGRGIACILMLSGIGFISMLTSAVSTYFIVSSEKSNNEKLTINNDVCDDRQAFVLDLSDLNEEQKKQVISFYQFIKKN